MNDRMMGKAEFGDAGNQRLPVVRERLRFLLRLRAWLGLPEGLRLVPFAW